MDKDTKENIKENDKFDSILKDEENEESFLSKISDENSKTPNYALRIIFMAIVCLIISYIVYFNVILNGKNIFLNDINVIMDNFSIIFDKLNIKYDPKSMYSFKGNITIKNNNYTNKLDYDFENNTNIASLNISNDNVDFDYYTDSVTNYIKFTTIGNDYIKSESATIFDYINLYATLQDNIKNYLSNKNNYNKTTYLSDDKPVVKIELNLNKDEINSIIGINKLNIQDDYNLNIELINNAFTNEIISVKAIVNNKTTKDRDVYIYQENTITHTNSNGADEKVTINVDNKDKSEFTLKYYDNDILYGVLTGKTENTGYEYLYQVIDKIYNIKLTFSNNDNSYNYLFDINIDEEGKKYDMEINIDGEYSLNSDIKNTQITNSIDKTTLDDTTLDKYKNIKTTLFGFDINDVITSKTTN